LLLLKIARPGAVRSQGLSLGATPYGEILGAAQRDGPDFARLLVVHFYGCGLRLAFHPDPQAALGRSTYPEHPSRNISEIQLG